MRDPDCLVYDDSVIAIGLFAREDTSSISRLYNLGIRWLPPQAVRRGNEELHELTNAMGGATDWFLLPSSLGSAIGKHLVAQKAGGLPEFIDEGYQEMVSWLVEIEELPDAMCY